MGVQGFKQLFNAFYSALYFRHLTIGWIGKVSCIPGHLALEVLDDLSIPEIWG